MNNRQSKFLQLLFVFAAFALMAVAAYLFNSRMLRNHLMKGAQELLLSAEANVKAALSEAEITLLNSYYIIEGMLEGNASEQEILDYLIITTDWMQRRDMGLVNFYGIYGYINGEFYDGIGMNPGPDYIPQTRPWYQTAIRSGENVAYTTPYIDWNTGDMVVSAVRNIHINDIMIGILAVDISINWLIDYVSTLTLAEGGFGMLLSQNLIFMAYPDENLLGRQLQDLGGVYESLAQTLRSGENVYAQSITDPHRGSVIVFINKIFNNWYVGLITPSSEFFRELQSSAQIMFLLGFLLSLALSFVLVRLSAAKERSDEESRAKSSFLARMSHEIRTPLNAVIGLAEIVLNRGKLPPVSIQDVQQIHQSGSSLLGIINDILDISKIEAGGFELVPVEYETVSLIYDTANLNKVRIGSKPINFLLEIPDDLPSRLYGDEIRVRQIMNNLLSNAIKYTKEGTVKLSISWEKEEASHEIKFCFSVQDTGMGIQAEDMEKLFTEYTQFDAHSNRQVEGTGLGLSITKKLVEMMSGTINVESEYGKGSTFTVNLLQTAAETEGSLRGIGKDTAEKLKHFNYTDPGKNTGIIRNFMPYGRVLIVDDLPVNLQVARGLLEPYGLNIDTANSGQEAVDLILAGNKYNLVFMDHMMPEMDGIEAAAIIRNWEEENENEERLPIIALTANALAGNMEMFMSKGFNGFVPKPIDIIQLDDTLNLWIRDKQNKEILEKAETERKENIDLEVNKKTLGAILSSLLEDIDVQHGIKMTGGTENKYIEVLSFFRNDAESRLMFFSKSPENNDLKQFITQVHALKSASASIGAEKLSILAEELEKAGKKEDMDYINEKLPDFMKQLKKMVINITAVLERKEEIDKQNITSLLENSKQHLSGSLKELLKALKSGNAAGIDRELEKIREVSLEVYEELSDDIMMADYDKAREKTEKIITGDQT